MIDPRNQFGPVAESYLTSQVHSNPNALERMIQVVKPHGGTVVDVATGAGHTAYAFAPFVDRMIATDITESMLELTKKTAEERGLTNVETTIAKAESLPFDDGSITGVTCRMGAHHFDDVPKFLEEAYRVLAPGGWLLVVDTIGDDDDEADGQVDHLERVRDPSHRRNYRTFEWKRMAEDAGFKVEHTEESWKAIDIEDWLNRMRVADEDKEHLRQVIDNAKGRFAEYLHPQIYDGKQHFHLRELLMLARK